MVEYKELYVTNRNRRALEDWIDKANAQIEETGYFTITKKNTSPRLYEIVDYIRTTGDYQELYFDEGQGDYHVLDDDPVFIYSDRLERLLYKVIKFDAVCRKADEKAVTPASIMETLVEIQDLKNECGRLKHDIKCTLNDMMPLVKTITSMVNG